MSIRDKAYVAGIYEHPCRTAATKTLAQLHAEIAQGALADAGLSMNDVDADFCAGDAPGLGPLNMIEYLGLQNIRHMDSTETGGSSYWSMSIMRRRRSRPAIATSRSSPWQAVPWRTQ